jgi:hypothetical protein
MKLIGALKAAKRTAPFYSAVDEALAAIKRPKGTGAEFYTELTKQAGVKKAELADRKLEQAFKAKGKMTKEEAQQVLKDNPPPKLQEKTFTEPMDDYERDEALRDNMERFGYESWEDVPPRIMRKWEEELDENVEKYGDYRTAGGKNYREILLKLPESRPNPNNYRDPAQYDADMRSFNASGKADYQSTHWKEDPNVLAHMRVQDRTGPNGEKILHVEEIQSDWHQEGRKKGYAKPETKRLKGTVEEQTSEFGFAPEYKVTWEDGTFSGGYGSREQAQARAVEGKSDAVQGVPDAPFKKNWHELAMKRLLNYAADNGYDSIAITPGAEQAKRFNLRNQVDELLYKQNEDGTYQLSAQKNGRGDLLGEKVPVEKLEDYVGKEVAQRIVDNAGTERNLGGSGSVSQPKDVWGSLSGEGLEVGGAGMIGFYDQILPSYLNTFGKQYGAKVDLMPVDVGGFKVNRDNYPLPYRLESATSPDIISRFATPEEAWAEAQRRGSLAVHNFPITQPMRESIKQKGLPLYQQVGIPTAGAGAASQALQPEEEAGLATGGVVKSAIKQAQLAKLAKMRQEMAPRAEAVKALIARDENRYLADVAPNSLTNAEIEAEIKRMAAKAPMFMKPSALTELRKTVQQEKGDYGSRRVERAADEVPNLEKMYQQEALQQAFTGDNAKALMTMNPADFEKYAIPLEKRIRMGPKAKELALRGEIDKYTVPTDELIKYLANLNDGFQHLPYLNIFKDELGLPVRPNIVGHEGRHRNRALAERGETSGLVQLNPSGDLREGMPRRSQEEFIEALKQELESTNKLVYPESDRSNIRPPIILPDVYAKGGAVKPKVKDSKSGKVRMTKNRDTMFMELSNKKLKRK